MIPLIQQAVAVGWTAKQILDFISNKMKNLAPNVSNARKSGHSDEDILKFLQGKIKTGNVKEPETAYGKYLKESGVLTPEESQQRKAKGVKAALGAGAAALGAYQLYKNYSPMIQSGAQAIGQLMEGEIPTMGSPAVSPQPQEGSAPVEPQQMQQPSPQQEPDLTQQAEGEALQAAEAGLDETQNLQRRYLDQKKLGDRLRTLKKAGKSREEMVDFLKKKMPMMEQEYIRSIGFTGEPGNLDQRLGEMVDAYFPMGNKQQPEEVAEAVEVKEIPPPGKGSKMITPDGELGTIEELPGKTAKLDIDGKKRVFESEDLVQAPENEDEVLDLYEKLVEKIPEQYRSSMLNWVGYDPDQQILQVKFHTGDSYTYENIPEEFASKLENVLFTAKTSGGNFYGNWAQGEESRGAGVSALIKELQSKYGRGQEFSAKFKEVYSFFGLPEEKKREKVKREREEKKKAKRKKTS